jgi:serine/threonine-protein kinase
MLCAKCGAPNADGSVLCAACAAPLAAPGAGLTSSPTGPLDPHLDVPTVFAPGQALGERYTVVERVGAGGMGMVYKAIDRRLGKTVALKLIQAKAATRPAAQERFRRELALAQQVSHPNVCRVHDLGEVDGTTFISMEYVEGQTLEVLIHSMGHLSPSQTVALGRQICAGLAAIHERGIIHRDLKPGNVMVDRLGHVLLMDFGMAYRKDQERLTVEGAIFGTLAYLSPEQGRGQADFRSDVYALGLILYEMLTGKRPPGDDGPLPLALRAPEEPCPPPSRFSPEVPGALDAVVMRCLEREADKRFASVREAGEALAELGSTLTQTATLQMSSLPRAPSRRRAALAWGGGALAVVLAATLAWLTATRWHRPAAGVPAAPVSIAFLPLGYEGPEDSAYLKNLLPLTLGEDLRHAAGLQVTPFATSRSFESAEDAASVARQLGVGFVLRGHVNVREQVGEGALELADAQGRAVWTRGFKRPLTELVQDTDELRAEIGRAVGVREAPPAATRDPAALQAYLEGLTQLEGWDVKENYTRAQQAFARAVQLQPDFAEAHAGLALALLNEFNATRQPALVERALTKAEQALKLAPNLPEPRVARGVVHVWRGRSAEAAEEFRRAAELAPGDDSIFRRIGAAYSRAGRNDEADEAFKRAIELRPTFWDNYNQAGGHYLDTGRVEEAKAAYRRVIDLRPERAIGYANLGGALIFAGELQEAEPVLVAAITREPTPGARINLGVVYDSLGRHEDAVKQYQLVIESGNVSADLYVNLADALRHGGRRTEADEAYARATSLLRERLALDPTDTEASAKLAIALAGSRRCSSARAVAGRVSLNTRPAFGYYVMLTHALCGDKETAVRLALECLKNHVAADLQTNVDLKDVAADPRVKTHLQQPRD